MLAYLIATLCYLLVFIWVLCCLITKNTIHREWNLLLCFVALFAHIYHVYPNIVTVHGLNFNVFNVSSLISVFLVSFFLLFALYRGIISLAILATPVALLGINMGFLETYLHSASYKPLINLSQGLVIHIVLSIAAYSMLLMSAVHSIILRLQIRELKHNTNQRMWVSSLPSLQTMETLLFDMLITGFVLLTIALSIGFFYVDNLFTQHIAHKTMFSVLSWLLFGYLIYAHWRFGWRGQRASTFTLYGFGLLAVGFVGSKVVLELVLV